MSAPTSPADNNRRIRYRGDTGIIWHYPTDDTWWRTLGKATVLLDRTGWARVRPDELELIDDDQVVAHETPPVCDPFPAAPAEERRR